MAQRCAPEPGSIITHIDPAGSDERPPAPAPSSAPGRAALRAALVAMTVVLPAAGS